MNQVNNYKASHIKLHLLSEGISYSNNFLDEFGKDNQFMPKRRAYNDSDDKFISRERRVPQEIIISDVVIAMNHKIESPWQIDVKEGNYFISHHGEIKSAITFPKCPDFFEIETEKGILCKSIANLYGGKSLAFFTPSTCYYFNEKVECRFCSLKPNRDSHSLYIHTITPSVAGEVTKIAKENDNDIISQIMLVGGNNPNYDKGFVKHIEIVQRIDEIQKDDDVQLETHIATMPPNDFSLIDELSSLNARITMNLEVFDDNIFKTVCPGKEKKFGRKKLLNALKYSAKKLDNKRTHSILIAGLEPVKSTIEGIRFLPTIGVTPIVNVFHNDKGSHYENYKRPSFNELIEIAYELEEVYNKYNLTPYWKGCGRNAIDFEALNKWFSYD